MIHSSVGVHSACHVLFAKTKGETLATAAQNNKRTSFSKGRFADLTELPRTVLGRHRRLANWFAPYLNFEGSCALLRFLVESGVTAYQDSQGRNRYYISTSDAESLARGVCWAELVGHLCSKGLLVGCGQSYVGCDSLRVFPKYRIEDPTELMATIDALAARLQPARLRQVVTIRAPRRKGMAGIPGAQTTVGALNPALRAAMRGLLKEGAAA